MPRGWQWGDEAVDKSPEQEHEGEVYGEPGLGGMWGSGVGVK